jgi:hypothetical protein
VCVAPAMASPILLFQLTFTASNPVSYAGGSAPLVGTQIGVDEVTGLATPANNGVFIPITGAGFSQEGTLDFTTGPFSYSTATNWNFSGGGSVTINGCADIDRDFDHICDAAEHDSPVGWPPARWPGQDGFCQYRAGLRTEHPRGER